MSLRTARGRAEESSRCELEAVRPADPSIHFVSTRCLLASVPHGIVHEDGAPAIYFLGLPTYNQVLGPKNQDSFFFVKPNIDAAGFGILRMGHFTTIGLTLVANVEIKVCRTIVLEDV